MSFVMKLGTKPNYHMLHTSFKRSKQDVNFSLVSLCQILSISTIMLVTTMGLLLFATSFRFKLKQSLVPLPSASGLTPQNFAKCSQLHMHLHWGAKQFCNHECNCVLCKWYRLDNSKMKIKFAHQCLLASNNGSIITELFLQLITCVCDYTLLIGPTIMLYVACVAITNPSSHLKCKCFQYV